MNYFTAIVAMDEHRLIGCGNRIPWHIPGDLKWFKSVTIGNVVVMGRKTFESIGKPLPGRDNVVLSRSGFSFPGVVVVEALEKIPEIFPDRKIFICGGAQVYKLALPLCNELLITHVKGIYSGDVYFPEYENRFQLVEILAEFETHKIARYRNLYLPCNLENTYSKSSPLP